MTSTTCAEGYAWLGRSRRPCIHFGNSILGSRDQTSPVADVVRLLPPQPSSTPLKTGPRYNAATLNFVPSSPKGHPSQAPFADSGQTCGLPSARYSRFVCLLVAKTTRTEARLIQTLVRGDTHPPLLRLSPRSRRRKTLAPTTSVSAPETRTQYDPHFHI